MKSNKCATYQADVNPTCQHVDATATASRFKSPISTVIPNVGLFPRCESQERGAQLKLSPD